LSTDHEARKFYTVMAAAMTLGLALDYAGFNAVKMLFWSAVINSICPILNRHR